MIQFTGGRCCNRDGENHQKHENLAELIHACPETVKSEPSYRAEVHDEGQCGRRNIIETASGLVTSCRRTKISVA